MTDTATAPVLGYANYWETDTVMNPKLVTVLSQDGEFYNVRLPNGEGERHVHLHHLGNVHHG